MGAHCSCTEGLFKSLSAGRLPKNELLSEYELGKLLGQGAFGAVYQCTKIGTSSEYAVKMIDVCQSPLEQIKQEADLLSEMDHRNVVKIHKVFYEEVFVCIVMDIHKGGELIARMQKHWKDVGRIPVAKASHIAYQLCAPVAYLHSKAVVHRDVKVDNYLTSPDDLLERSCTVYLADFGTARYLKQGERLKEMCGTKLYWSPEFHQRDYSFKVDLWAIGVCLYGLCEGRFPFADAKEVFRKPVKPPTGIPEKITKAVLGLLEKEEESRLSTDQMMQEPWIEEGRLAAGGGVAVRTETKESDVVGEGWSPTGPVMAESGANTAVRNRRHELVDRLEHQAQIRRGKTSGMLATEVDYRQPSFAVTDRHTQRTLKAQWWAESKIAQYSVIPANTTARYAAAQSESLAASRVAVVKDMLEDYGIDTSRFGVGGARTMQEFAEEVEAGSAKLMLDARKTKALVRVVDICLLRLACTLGGTTSYVVETLQQYEDGRHLASTRLPGTKKAPYESTRGAVQRLIVDIMGLQDFELELDFDIIEVSEEEESSPSFPGVRTVYRKEMVAGLLLTTDPKTLAKIGIHSEVAQSGWKWRDEGLRTNHVFKWMAEKQCAAGGVQLNVGRSSQKISWLVWAAARVHVDEDALENRLQSAGVDVSQWGQVSTKSVADLAREISQGESSLMTTKEGHLLRVCDVVLMRLAKADTGDVLVEVQEAYPTGETKVLNRLPGVTKQAEENEFIAFKRVLKSLRIDENSVLIDGAAVHTVDEEKCSPSYPGLRTLYRKRVIGAKLET